MAENKSLDIKKLLEGKKIRTISMKESLKDIEPIPWAEDVLNGERKIEVGRAEDEDNTRISEQELIEAAQELINTHRGDYVKLALGPSEGRKMKWSQEERERILDIVAKQLSEETGMPLDEAQTLVKASVLVGKFDTSPHFMGHCSASQMVDLVLSEFGFHALQKR